MRCMPYVDVDPVVTHVHRKRAFTDDLVVPFEAPTIDSFLQRELAIDEGTPEWRSWLARAARRHGVLLAVT